MKKIIVVMLIGLAGEIVASQFDPSARAQEGHSFVQNRAFIPNQSKANKLTEGAPKSDEEKLRELQEQFDSQMLTLALVDAHSTAQGGFSREQGGIFVQNNGTKIDKALENLNQVRGTPSVSQIENCCAALLFRNKAAEPSRARDTLDAVECFLKCYEEALFQNLLTYLPSDKAAELKLGLRCVKMLQLMSPPPVSATYLPAVHATLREKLEKLESPRKNGTTRPGKNVWLKQILSPRVLVTAGIMTLVLGYFILTRDREEKKK